MKKQENKMAKMQKSINEVNNLKTTIKNMNEDTEKLKNEYKIKNLERSKKI